jgi:hypothetical protein
MPGLTKESDACMDSDRLKFFVRMLRPLPNPYLVLFVKYFD